MAYNLTTFGNKVRSIQDTASPSTSYEDLAMMSVMGGDALGATSSAIMQTEIQRRLDLSGLSTYEMSLVTVAWQGNNSVGYSVNDHLNRIVTIANAANSSTPLNDISLIAQMMRIRTFDFGFNDVTLKSAIETKINDTVTYNSYLENAQCNRIVIECKDFLINNPLTTTTRDNYNDSIIRSLVTDWNTLSLDDHLMLANSVNDTTRFATGGTGIAGWQSNITSRFITPNNLTLVDTLKARMTMNNRIADGWDNVTIDNRIVSLCNSVANSSTSVVDLLYATKAYMETFIYASSPTEFANLKAEIQSRINDTVNYTDLKSMYYLGKCVNLSNTL